MSTHPNLFVWWKNRRRMAYGACVWAILQTVLWALLSVFYPSSMGALTPVVSWSYGLCATVIVGYFGNTAVEEFVKHKRLGGS